MYAIKLTRKDGTVTFWGLQIGGQVHPFCFHSLATAEHTAAELRGTGLFLSVEVISYAEAEDCI